MSKPDSSKPIGTDKGKSRVTLKDLDLFGHLQEIKKALKQEEAYIIIKERAMRVLKNQVFAKCADCDKMHPLNELTHVPLGQPSSGAH
jgi:hypothetical protein